MKLSEKINKEQWLIDYVKAEQDLPEVTLPEIYVRYALAEKFHISLIWAYEVIRNAVKHHPELHLEKVLIEYGDGKGPVHPEWELTWREEKT